ncbi:uncharacterized protein LOC119503824 isoform X2 [Sebastes umbrosus]|uniref:uncharacterized protein LOC119503824 isoform X2 n=1 Tax=Sebastes umbrosus TaxID=72105 RepID=UPI00189ED7B1|nr:uncharacterized protein LOC119503824 isoform X2 [Sebastes umbrosus]
MNLWLSSHFLVAGLFLSSSALTPEECQPLVTPLSLADPSMMYGRMNFIAGYTDNEVYNAMGKLTQSYWMNITASPSSPNEAISTQQNKMNGTCLASTMTVTIDGNTATFSIGNMTSVFHLLPSCDGCLLMSVNNTARNIDKMLQMMKFNVNVTGEEIHARGVYLMARESTLKDSDMEHFKKQASCLGFSREPDFLYDPKNVFCAEGEGIKMPF